MQDPPEGLSELTNAVGIDEGIHNRVGMGEDDGNVHHPNRWTVTTRPRCVSGYSLTQVVERVDDVQWKPT